MEKNRHIDLWYHKLKFVFFITLCTVVHTAFKKESDFEGPRPAHCIGHPDLLNRFCCILPPFFIHETARECGGVSSIFAKYINQNLTGLVRRSFNCGYWYCVLNKYELINAKGYVNLEKYFLHLDLWVTLNTQFSAVMLDAKVECKTGHRYYFPLTPCEFFNMNECIRNYLRVKCPAPITTKNCMEQKKFYEECGEYFLKK